MTLRSVALAGSLLSAVGVPSIARAPQEHRFRSNVEVVRVDALVTSGGRPLRGLTAADFEIVDNGVRQTVDRAQVGEVQLDLSVALDTSSSVEGGALKTLTGAVWALVDVTRPSDKVSVLAFTQAIELLVEGPGRSTIVDPDVVAAGGSTAWIDAAFAAILSPHPDDWRRLVITFTDGCDNSSWLTADDLIAAARRSDVVVYTVGVPDSTCGGEQLSARRSPMNALRELADATGGRFMSARSGSAANEAFRRILDESRERYVLSYSPRGVDTPGWHAIQVRVLRRGATVKARPGYDRGTRAARPPQHP